MKIHYILTINTHYGEVQIAEWYVDDPEFIQRVFQEAMILANRSFRKYLEIGDFSVPFGFQIKGNIL